MGIGNIFRINDCYTNIYRWSIMGENYLLNVFNFYNYSKSYFKCILTYMFYTSRLFGFFLEVNNNNGSFLCKKLDNCLWPVPIIIISNEIFLTKWADLSFDVLDVFKSEEPWAQWKWKVTIKLKDMSCSHFFYNSYDFKYSYMVNCSKNGYIL